MGRDALPGQEIEVGRAQVTQEVTESQVYLPMKRKDDIDRLSHLTANQSMNPGSLGNVRSSTYVAK